MQAHRPHALHFPASSATYLTMLLHSQACSSQGLILHGSGMLLPCGADRFRGVEYVCCPPPVTSDPSGAVGG